MGWGGKEGREGGHFILCWLKSQRLCKASQEKKDVALLCPPCFPFPTRFFAHSQHPWCSSNRQPQSGPSEGRWDPCSFSVPDPSLSARLGVPQLTGLQTGLYLQNPPPSPSTLALTFLFQQKPNSFKASLIEIQKLSRASAPLSTPPHTLLYLTPFVPSTCPSSPTSLPFSNH